MKERTLKVLARVQAVREAAARRRLEEASRQEKDSREQADELSRERDAVRSEYGPGAGPLAAHAERYEQLLARRELASREELVDRMAQREEARREFLRVLLKSDILARHAAAGTRGSE